MQRPFSYFSESRAIRALSRVSLTGPWVRLVVGFGKTEDPAKSNPSAAELSGLSSSDNRVPVPLKRKTRDSQSTTIKNIQHYVYLMPKKEREWILNRQIV